MKIIRNNIKSIISKLLIVIMLTSVSCVFIFFKKNINKINVENNKVELAKYNTNNETPSIYNLLHNIKSVGNYLDIIISKQKSLLNKINCTIFHTLRMKKNLFINHKYIGQANTIIKLSDNSLDIEKKILRNIYLIIRNHQYNYSFYLEKNHYIVPYFDFFINNRLSNFNKSENINNYSYKIKKTDNLNNISINTEEVYFGTKKISKTSTTLINTIFKNYNFRANIISFNYLTHSFEFKRIIKKSKIIKINTNKSNVLNNKFLSKKQTYKNTTNKYLNKLFLDSLFSINNYQKKFDYHFKECFRTYLDINNVELFSKNKVTYIVFPIIIGIITDSIIIVTGLVGQKISNIIKSIKNKKLLQEKRIHENWMYNVETTILNRNDIMAPRVPYVSLLDTISKNGIRNAPESRYSIEKSQTIATFNVGSTMETDTSGKSTFEQHIYLDFDGSVNLISIEIEHDESHYRLGFIKDETKPNYYKTRKIETKILNKKFKKVNNKKVKVIKLHNSEKYDENTESHYLNITNYLQKFNDTNIIYLPTTERKLDLFVYTETDFA